MKQKFNVGIWAAAILFAVAIYSFFQLDFLAGFMLLFAGCTFGIVFGEE